METKHCDICNKRTTYIHRVGISLTNFTGYDYTFCENCLKNMTADEFWKIIFEEDGYIYPPKPLDEI